MILVFGGAYQGKLDYAVKLNGGNIDDVTYLNENKQTIDFNKTVIYGLEDFVMGCTKAGVEAKEYLMTHEGEFDHCIFVGCDVSQGLVPMDATERAFREMMGRTMLYLAGRADSVYRVFCGLGTKIK